MDLPAYNSVPRIKRSRKITICLSCYKRRVKCSKDKPQCKQCVQLSIKCEYAHQQSPPAQQPRQPAKRKTDDLATCKRDVGVLAVNNSTGESIYANTAYWPSFFQEGSNMDEILNAPNGGRDPDEILESSQCRRLVEAYLPDQDTVEDLIREFFRVVHPFCPLIDRETFLALYDAQFWDAVNDPGQVLLITFISLLFALLYGGCLSRIEILKYSDGPNKAADLKMYISLSQKLLTAFETAMRIHKFPERPSLTCLVGCTVIQLCRRKDGMLDTTIDIARLIRIAQVMGLHRDPELFRASGLDDFQVNLRRRLWWHLVHLDVAASLGNGVPCTTQISQFDVKFPTDEYLHLDEDKLYHNFMNSRWSGTRTMSKLLSEFYGINQPAPAKADAIYLELVDLRKEYTETKERIQALKFEKISSRASLPILKKVQSQLVGVLDIVCEKFFLIYYLSIMSTSSEDGYMASLPQGEARTRRKKIVGMAMRVVKLFVKYSAIPDYFELIWSLERYHQFHALILILRDIYHHPNDTLEFDVTENGQTYDERVAVLEQGLATTEFLGLNSVSQLAEKQWRTFLRLKDVTWARKFLQPVPPAQMTQTSQAQTSQAQAQTAHTHTAQTPVAVTAATYQPDTTTTLPVLGTFLTDLNGDEYSNFWSAQEYTDKAPGSGNEFVQHLLAMNSWDIDWTSYGFNLETQPRSI